MEDQGLGDVAPLVLQRFAAADVRHQHHLEEHGRHGVHPVQEEHDGDGDDPADQGGVPGEAAEPWPEVLDGHTARGD